MKRPSLPFLGLMFTLTSGLVPATFASPVIISANANALFSSTASASYTVQGSGNGSGTGSFTPASGLYTVSNTFMIENYAPAPDLDDGLLFLDLSQAFTYDPLVNTAGDCVTHGNNNAHCGNAPSFTSTPSSYFVQISSPGGTVLFPIATASATNLDISSLAADFIAGHAFTITVAQSDMFIESGALTNWVRADRTYSLSQSLTSDVHATIWGAYTPVTAAAVPEPAGFFLTGGALVILGIWRTGSTAKG